MCYRTAHAAGRAVARVERRHPDSGGIRGVRIPAGQARGIGFARVQRRSEALLCYITGGRTFRISGSQISMVTLVRVNHKGQMTIPRTVRSAVGLAAGDMVDVRAIGKAQRLDLVPLLDSILPPKRHQGLSVGQYLLLAAINRAVSP